MPDFGASIVAAISAASAAIGSAAAATAAALTAAAATIGITVTITATQIITVGLSLLSSLAVTLFAPGVEAYSPNNNQQVDFASDPKQQFLFGTLALGGSIVYAYRRRGYIFNLEDERNDNRTDYFMIVLGVGEHGNLISVIIDDERFYPQPIAGEPNAFRLPGKYFDYCKLWYYRGTENQVASQPLRDNPTGEWTANHRAQGICYAVMGWFRDFEADVLKGGIPFARTKFELEGIAHYDPRKDSTQGGSGAHRVDDKSTWEYTSNPALQWFTYQRGLTIAGKLVFGRKLYSGTGQLPQIVSDMIPSVNTAADVCDEVVITKDGRSIPRYSCHIYLDHSISHNGIESLMLNSMAGVQFTTAGQRKIIAGSATPPTVEVTDLFAHGIPSVDTLMSDTTSLVNTVLGQYIEPKENYKVADVPPYSNADWIAEDGQEQESTFKALSVTENSQMQRLCKIVAAKSRYGGALKFLRPLDDADLYHPGAIITVTDEVLSWVQKRFRVVQRVFFLSKDPGDLDVLQKVTENFFWQVSCVHEPEETWQWDVVVDEQRRTTITASGANETPQLGTPNASFIGTRDVYVNNLDFRANRVEWIDSAGNNQRISINGQNNVYIIPDVGQTRVYVRVIPPTGTNTIRPSEYDIAVDRNSDPNNPSIEP